MTAGVSRVVRRSRVAHRAVAFLGLPLLLAACATAASRPASPPAGSPLLPSPTSGASGSPPVRPSASPVAAFPSGTPTTKTAFDGIWATKPLARADAVAALALRGLDDAGLDEAFQGWDDVHDRIFELEIGGGRWQAYDNSHGVSFGVVWGGAMVAIDADTIVAQDDGLRCPVRFDLSRDGDTLSVRIADDACGDQAGQVPFYESGTFRLVQADGWAPPATSAPPSPMPPMLTPSSSSKRQVLRSAGTVDGAPLGYLEYLPPDYGKAPSPLLVFLHGSGESGTGDEASLAKLTATGLPSAIWQDQWPDARPFVVLSPQHDEQPPSFCMEADEIDAFLRFAIAHYDVDPKRVYLTGLSCGAIGLWNYLGAHGGELVAAAVPMSGYGIGAVERAGCDLARVPIWAFHGALDDAVPVRGDVYPISTLRTCTAPPAVDARVTVYPDREHDVWWFTYSGAAGYDIYAWLLSHHR